MEAQETLAEMGGAEEMVHEVAEVETAVTVEPVVLEAERLKYESEED